jgi:hypothetical protein
MNLRRHRRVLTIFIGAPRLESRGSILPMRTASKARREGGLPMNIAKLP